MKRMNSEAHLIKQVSLEERINLISNYPIFCLLTSNAIYHLASLFNEVHIQKNEIIVREEDNFDGFFLIVSGNAVVSRALKRIQKTNPKPITTLGPKRAIGLGNAGYFSKQGQRNATVTALSSMTLLHIDLLRFYNFLKEYSSIYPSLISTSEKFLLFQYLQAHSHLFQPAVNDEAQKKKSTVFEQEQMILELNNDKHILRDILNIEAHVSLDECGSLIKAKLRKLGCDEFDLVVKKVNTSPSPFIKQLIRKIAYWGKGNIPSEQKE